MYWIKATNGCWVSLSLVVLAPKRIFFNLFRMCLALENVSALLTIIILMIKTYQPFSGANSYLGGIVEIALD